MFKKISKSEWFLIILIFLAGFLVRFWPELRAGTYPIGYDTLNTYIPDILRFDGNFFKWIMSANLLYFIFWPFYKLFGMNPNLIVKIAGPVLYGLMAVIMYLFSRKAFNFDKISSFTVSLFVIFQLPMLRLSWDLYRNMLGLIFLFPALYYLQNEPFNPTELKNRYKPPVNKLILFSIFSVLVILSNQLVASVWIIVVVTWAFKHLAGKNSKEFWKVILFSLPAIALFIIIAKNNGANTYGNHVIYESESGRIFNYVNAYKNSIKYSDLASTILGLFWLCYGFILPLVVYGFWHLRKNVILTILTIWLLVGTFSSLIFGGYGIFVWDRWMLMLALPFSIYAVSTIRALYTFINNKFSLNIHRTIEVVGILLLAIYFGFLIHFNWPFVNDSYDQAKAPFVNSKINNYFPITMIHNAVGFNNIKDVIASIDYINKNAPVNSVIMIDNRYRGLMLTRLDYSKRYIYSYPWSEKVNKSAIEELRNRNTGPIYTIWSSQDSITGFKKAFSQGLVAVYRDQQTYRAYLQTIE